MIPISTYIAMIQYSETIFVRILTKTHNFDIIRKKNEPHEPQHFL